MVRPAHSAVCILLMLSAGACAAQVVQAEPKLTSSAKLCDDRALGPKSFCLPKRAETLLETGKFEILADRKPSSGLGGARTLYLEYPSDDVVIKAKWKPAHKGGNSFNNEPRKELAAYKMQTLFLSREEFVVPPTVGRCLDAGLIQDTGRPAVDTFEGAPCVYGVLAYWLNNVSSDNVLDLPRFDSDPAYRESVANLNLLTYLIDHRDTRRSNFLISTDPEHPRVFAVDNGLAFSGFRNPIAYLKTGWSEIIVPSLPRKKIDRLRKLTRADLDTLLVVSQYKVRHGGLAEVPPTAAISDKDGVRRDEDVIQFGLTRREIDGIARRLKALIERVDRGEIQVF